MSVGLPSGSVQIRRIIYSEESEPIVPVFYDDIADVNTNALVLDTVLEYDPLIRIQGYYWNGIRNVPIPDAPAFVLPQVPSATLLLDLEADMLGLNDGDPVSTWADQSGNHNDFTQTGTARPKFVASYEGYPAVYFAGQNPDTFDAVYMVGPNSLADNLPSFAVFYLTKFDVDSNWSADFLAKDALGANNIGWRMQKSEGGGVFIADFVVENADGSLQVGSFSITGSGFSVCESEKLAADSGHIYINGDNTDESVSGSVGDFSNASNVLLGSSELDLPSNGESCWCRAVLIYQITDVGNWATDRAAITTWLANRYGITL